MKMKFHKKFNVPKPEQALKNSLFRNKTLPIRQLSWGATRLEISYEISNVGVAWPKEEMIWTQKYH